MALTSTSEQTSLKAPGTSVEPLSRWALAFGSSEADGYVIENPYEDIDNFIPYTLFGDPDNPHQDDDGNEQTPLCRRLQDGGRVFVVGEQQGRLEILPCFTDPDASGTIQVFGFDWVHESTITATTTSDGDDADLVADLAEARRLLAKPDVTSPYGLGFHYNLSRDATGVGQTLPIETSGDTSETSEYIQLQVNGWRVHPYPYGTVYHTGPRLIFDTAGLYAFFLWVPTLTAGNLVLLMRVI